MKMSLTLPNLPIEMVYRILDHLNDESLYLSFINVCQRLNRIIYSSQRYQVNHYFFLVSLTK